MSNTKDIRGSHGLISTALHDDKVLLPGKPIGPDSLLLKRMNVDINYLMFELESIQLEYIIQTNIMIAEKLREEKEELLKELDYLEEVKMKIREMQSDAVTGEGKLTQTQVEQLATLQRDIERNIALIDKQIVQLKAKIALLSSEINKLDEEISQSVKEYRSLIKEAFKAENIKKELGDKVFVIADGKIRVTSADICTITEKVIKAIEKDPSLNFQTAVTKVCEEWRDSSLDSEYASLPEKERKIKIEEGKSDTGFADVKDFILGLKTQEMVKKDEDIQIKKIIKVGKQGEKMTCEKKLEICEAAKANLTDYLHACHQVTSGKKADLKLAQHLQTQGPDVVSDIMKSASKICAELGVDLDLAPEPEPPSTRHGLRS